MLYLLILAVVSHGISAAVLDNGKAVTIVSRAGWGARSPTSTTGMSTPVPYVVIHHSAGPACTTNSACQSQMRSMQNLHMDTNGWADIGYSFGVGGDGLAYEGRGWARVGAHAPGFNDRSIGICNIGTFTSVLPPASQLTAVKELIAQGVSLGRISSNYKLIGHRQAVSTECPGNRLYEEIKTWPHYTATPTYEDLLEGKYEEDIFDI
ncbi:peptidoglycan-recognition protein SC2-like [Arctopsyche grandis]|uniref:peptidoglycan-recognition protein SC2-like n=1 Tax=Arctopsyche grandis TaxID=121162 RepID=UPI00406D66A0